MLCGTVSAHQLIATASRLQAFTLTQKPSPGFCWIEYYDLAVLFKLLQVDLGAAKVGFDFARVGVVWGSEFFAEGFSFYVGLGAGFQFDADCLTRVGQEGVEDFAAPGDAGVWLGV